MITADTNLIIPALVPERGETILIHRPGYPDIRMRFEVLNPIMPAPSPGWLWLGGEILDGLPNQGFWQWQTLYARPVEPGVYQMVGVQ